MSGLTPEETHLVDKLFDSAFRGYAQARLAKLSPRVLDALVSMCSSPKDTAIGADASTDEKVKRVLEAKKELVALQRRSMETRCATPAPPPATDGPVVDIPEAPPPPPRPKPPPSPPEPPQLTAAPPAATSKILRPVFKPQHEINIIAFNSLKLRLDREELQEEWDAAILEFAKYDVLMLSEVRASDKLFKARAARLIEMLEDCTEEQWTWQVSEPAGPGTLEVHLVIAKRPLDIVAVETLMELDGLVMDHAPFVVGLDDPRFVGELRRINVISVHMPPKSSKERRAQRDVQIRKLTQSYTTSAANRLNTPFTNQSAKDSRKKNPYVAHIIGGDFNADAKELRELEVEKHGWEVVLGSVRTSSGGKSYDNWLLNRDCKDHLTLGADVLDLAQYANFSRGQQGISDHAPIALRIREIPRMAAPAVAQTRAAARKAKACAATSEWLASPTDVTDPAVAF